MATIVKPSFFNPSSFNVKKYTYNGAPVSKPQLFEYTDMPEIDYSNPVKSKNNILVGNIDTRVRVGASIVNTGVSVIKGLASFVEALTDTATMIAGGVASIAAVKDDLGNFISSKINGEEWKGFQETRALLEDGILPFVGTNYTEKIFDKIYYDTSFGKSANDLAFDCCKKDGLVCQIGEGIGYYTGVVALATVTAGVGGAAVMPTSVAHGLVMGGAAIGRNTQSGYNNLTDAERHDAGSLAKLVGVSTATGVVEGLTYTAGVEGANHLASYMTRNGVNALATQVARAGTQAVIKSTRPVINETVEHFAYGTDWDGKEVAIQVGGTFAAEAVGAIVEANVSNSLAARDAAQNVANQFSGAQNGTNLVDIALQADPSATQAFEYFMDEQIVFAATEWSEGATHTVVTEPATEYLDAA